MIDIPSPGVTSDPYRVLLNPGPSNTRLSTRLAQVVHDVCPREDEFCHVMARVSQKIASLVRGQNPVAVLFCGSGTLAVESVLQSALSPETKALFINNGAYSQRMCDMARVMGLQIVEFKSSMFDPIDYCKLEDEIMRNGVKFVCYVHSETTTGLLNDSTKIASIARRHGALVVADCMSSFGAYHLSLDEMDYIISSSAKNIQALPGISFVVSSPGMINAARFSRSLYLDLCAQYEHAVSTGQMRFTPPTSIMYALDHATDLLEAEGLDSRIERYERSNRRLRAGLVDLGFDVYPKDSYSRIVTTVSLGNYSFQKLHDFCKGYGFIIYPGKVDGYQCFRVANIGDIDVKEIDLFLYVIERFKKDSN